MFLKRIQKMPKMTKNKGFSLLEVMVALTILAMVLSMIYTILISTLNARTLIQNETEADRIGTRLVSLIARDIQAAYMYQLDEACFVGRNRRRIEGFINFVTSNDSLMRRGSDICEVGYFVEENPREKGTYCLYRREDFFVDSYILKGGTAVLVYDRLLSLQFRFYTKKGGIRTNWNSKQQKGLPVAVEVTLKIPIAAVGSSPLLLQKDARVFQINVPIVVSTTAPEVTKSEKSK